MFAHQYDLAVELNLRHALSNERIVGLGDISLDYIRYFSLLLSDFLIIY